MRIQRSSLVLLALLLSCASGTEPGPGQPVDAAGSVDARAGSDDARANPDARPSADSAATLDAAGELDPDLEIADPSGQVCTALGSLGQCAGAGTVCRFYDRTEGRCESCSPCGNLGASCTASDQCDVVFMCFRGRCTNFCTLGTYECGPIADCLDVGHASRGVCRP